MAKYSDIIDMSSNKAIRVNIHQSF